MFAHLTISQQTINLVFSVRQISFDYCRFDKLTLITHLALTWSLCNAMFCFDLVSNERLHVSAMASSNLFNRLGTKDGRIKWNGCVSIMLVWLHQIDDANLNQLWWNGDWINLLSNSKWTNTHTHMLTNARSNIPTDETNELNFVHDAQIKNGCAYAINNRLIRNGF